MKFRKTFMSSAISAMLLIIACDKNEITSTTPTITALSCSTATFSATPKANTAFTGTATVPYTGGNGVAYSAGSGVASTGVTGLTATLSAGVLASGNGNLTFTISGTPSAIGTATFPIVFEGQACSFALNITAGTTGGTGTTGSNDISELVNLANAFMATLSAEQLALTQLPYTKENAIQWSNVSIDKDPRLGVQLGTLNSTQLAAATAFLKVAMNNSLLNEGYDEIRRIFLADDNLAAKGNVTRYNSGYYLIAFVGKPSLTGTWQLHFGGHHVAYTSTFMNGELVSGTPNFRAVEPISFTLNGETHRPLADEKEALVAMMSSLNATQLASAKLTTTFSDILLGKGQDGKFPATKLGILVSSLSNTQKQLVLSAMKPWVYDINETAAKKLMTIYEQELDNTYISYSGNTSLVSKGDYIRIDGPSVWIEFSCQNGVIYTSEIHYHSIWRDRKRDYGNNFSF